MNIIALDGHVYSLLSVLERFHQKGGQMYISIPVAAVQLRSLGSCRVYFKTFESSDYETCKSNACLIFEVLLRKICLPSNALYRNKFPVSVTLRQGYLNYCLLDKKYFTVSLHHKLENLVSTCSVPQPVCRHKVSAVPCFL